MDDVSQAIQQFLIDNELPLTLMGFVQQAIIDQKSVDEIISDLRQTPEYKMAYPENDLRQENGFSWAPESWIRGYRDQAKELIQRYRGYTPTNAEIATLIGKDASMGEIERRLQIEATVEKLGPAVQAVFEQQLGYTLSDERLRDFLDPSTSTPELDRAYENALYMGQPTALGFAVRPEQEADLLRQFGLSPERAFQGYQGIAAELPRAERLAAIQGEIARGVDKGHLPGLATDVLGQSSFSDLFAAIQLGDPDAIARLQRNISEETARFKAGGGPVSTGTQSVGLLSRKER